MGGQKFEAIPPGYINSVMFKLQRIDTVTGTVYCRVWDYDSGEVIGTLGSVPAADIPTTIGGTWVIFYTPVYNTSSLGRPIVIGCEYTGGDALHYIRLCGGDDHVANSHMERQIGGVWEDDTIWDAIYDLDIDNYGGLTLVVDGIELDNILSDVTIPDTANDLIVGSAATPYINSFSANISGVSHCYIDWEYDTVLHDSSGFDNDATWTPRSTSSSANVSAVVYSQESLAGLGGPDTEFSGWDMIPDVPAEPGSLYTEGGRGRGRGG